MPTRKPPDKPGAPTRSSAKKGEGPGPARSAAAASPRRAAPAAASRASREPSGNPGRPPGARAIDRPGVARSVGEAGLGAAAIELPSWWPARWPPRLYERARAYALLTRQDRPVGWLLLLWPTLWGLWLAAEGFPPIGVLAIFVAGVIVMRSAGCVANDWADRWLDPHVARTRERPLASGLVAPREALAVLGVLLLVAFGLVLLTNAKTIGLAVVALILALVYPFMKRVTWVPQLWLGLAFGMSVPMAATAVTDAWPAPVIWLAFLGNLCWTVAYDTLYAIVDRDDDLRVGARSTAILFGDLDLVATGVLLACFIAAMAMLGHRAGLGGWYAAGVAAAALVSAWTLWLARRRDRDGAFAGFRASHWAGFAIFAGLALDHALR
jgi:4-hydroxybenzoate polyprenyltransferase